MEDRQISLKQVLDEIARWAGYLDEDMIYRIQTGLKRLPSAQPELHYDEWCTDCKEYDQEQHCCPRFNKVIRETVEEYKAAQPSFSQTHENDHIADDSKMVAQPEPCDDPRADVYYLAEKIGIHQLYALVVELRGEPAQPEITDEQAIEHLQASGWMQNHDKQMSEMGLRERLYDALFPSAQPDNDMIHLQKEQAYLQGWEEGREALRKEQRWIPVTLETLPNLNSVVVVCGEKGTWDFGIYRGWYGDIHSWNWKNKSIKHVYWWMYKNDALPLPYREEGGD